MAPVFLVVVAYVMPEYRRQLHKIRVVQKIVKFLGLKVSNLEQNVKMKALQLPADVLTYQRGDEANLYFDQFTKRW